MSWKGRIVGGRYCVQSVLGEGAMGLILRAEDTRLSKAVAVKVLKPTFADNPRIRERFLREALAQANIEHPHIVRATDIVEDDGVLAIVLELVEGETLEQLLQRRGGKVPPAEATALLMPIMAAVRKAHECAVVHRDLKPANVLIGTDDQGAPMPKVTDFGIAKLLVDPGVAGATTIGTVMGTASYMPPEQLRGQLDIDVRADVYALGVMAYQMLTGVLPYGAGEQVPAAMASGHQPTPPSRLILSLPPSLDTVIADAMALERNERLPSVEALAAAWSAAMDAPATGPTAGATIYEAGPAHAETPAARQPPRSVTRGLVPVALLVVALGIGGAFLWSQRAQAPECRSDTDCADGETCRGDRCRVGRQRPGTASVDAVELQSGDKKPPRDDKGAGGPTPTPTPPRITWVRLPGGTFSMGGTGGDADEKPAHQVTVSGLGIGKTEVTVGQYGACVRAGTCTAPELGANCNWGTSGRDQHPINCVDHGQATAFCRWAGGRLPTEAEWEYAGTSGGERRKYPWGQEEASCARAVMADGGLGCGSGHTLPVCSKPRGNSAQGVCDLSGNVWEWVSDWYGPYPSSAQQNPKGPSSGSYRVLRGGGWNSANPSLLRARFRDRTPPAYRYDGLGFRCARTYP